MPGPLPVSLVASFTALFGFLYTILGHARRFQGTSRLYHMALYFSLAMGILAAGAILVQYTIHAGGYWAVVLILIGGAAGKVTFDFLGTHVGLLEMSLTSMVGWPACAYLMYTIVAGLVRG